MRTSWRILLLKWTHASTLACRMLQSGKIIIIIASRDDVISPVLQSLHSTVTQQNSPSYLTSKLELQSNRSTRSASVITLRRPPVQLVKGKRSFSSAASFLWNSLPTRIRQPASDSLTSTPALSRDTFHKQFFSHSYPPYDSLYLSRRSYWLPTVRTGRRRVSGRRRVI